MRPQEQLALVEQLLRGLDEPPGDHQEPGWEPPATVNEAASTLWLGLQDESDQQTQKLVTRVYAAFDDLWDGSLATQRPKMYEDLRQAATALRAHLQQRG